jgi:hypothetical protein
MGGSHHAGAAADPEALSAAAAAQGCARHGLSPRHHGNRELGDHAQGRRRGRPTLRVESPQHAGRRGRGVGPARGHPDLRDQRGRQHDLLSPYRIGDRPSPACHDGRWRGRGLASAFQTERSVEKRDRRHGRDHHRRHPPAQHGGKESPQVPGHLGQRCGHQAYVRQPVRHRAIHDGRYRAGDEPAGLRLGRRGRGLRLVRPRHRDAGQGHGRGRDRDGNRSVEGAGSGHGPAISM